MNTADNPYADNHIRLSEFLVVTGLFWGTLYGWIALLNWDNSFAIQLTAAIAGGVLVLAHFVLAWGCARRSKIARYFAVLLGVFVFFFGKIGPLPVGAYVCLFYFPLMQWEPTPPLDEGAPHAATSASEAR